VHNLHGWLIDEPSTGWSYAFRLPVGGFLYYMDLNIEEFDSPEDLPKGLKNIASELNKEASKALKDYFITEVIDEDTPPLEAQLLGRWAMTPVYFREEDEKTLDHLSSKLKISKEDLYFCMRSSRYRTQQQMLLSNGGHDDMLMQLVEDVIISKALAGDMPAINTLLRMTGKDKPPDRKVIQGKALTDLSDAELLKMLN
jgi:hypothetical protein